MAEQKFTQRVFGAEENSAATIDREQLSRFQLIAYRMFHTPVLRPREMAITSLRFFASALNDGINGYRTMFFVNVFKLDMSYVVAIMTLIGIYDVINNPLMGIAYDRTRTRWGKARPYALFTPIPYFLTTAILNMGGLFIVNDNTRDPRKAIFVFLVLFLQETFSTIYNIPTGNLPSLITPNPQDRIQLGIFSNYVGQFGGQIVYAIFMPLQDLNRWGVTNVSMQSLFAFFGILVFVSGTASSVAMALGVKERILLQPKPAPVTKSIFYILKNKYKLRNFVAGMACSVLSDGGYNWDLVTQLEISGGAFITQLVYLPWTLLNIASISFVPFFTRMFKGRFRNGLLFFRGIDMLRAFLQYFVGARLMKNRLWFNVALSFFLGVNGADNAPSAVMESEIDREIADYTEYMTGERPDGTIGLLTDLLSKVTTPLRALMTIKMFKWTQYDATQPMLPFQQGNWTVYKKVYFLYVLFGMLSKTIQTIPYFFYDLVGEKRERMYLELNERRALIAQEKAQEMSAEMETLVEALAESEKSTKE